MPTSNRPILLTWLLCGIGYAGYGMGGLIFLACVTPLALLLSPFKRQFSDAICFVLHHSIRFLTRVYLPLLRVYRIAELSGFNPPNRSTPAIYVANHRGRLDGLLLLGTVKRAGAIMKSRYAEMAFYGSLVRNCNFVSIDPSSLTSLGAAIERSRAILARGISLIVFPEGTRSAGNKMLPFKDFAFKLAIESGIDIIPVVIHSELPFMAKARGSYFPRYRFDYRVRFLSAVHPQPGDRCEGLSDRVRRMMADQLKAFADEYPQGASSVETDPVRTR
jgi:1-acyl-sn-glycerol-3-phosphate acyltransferase